MFQTTNQYMFFLSIGTMMTNSFKLGARYSIKLISCQKCPYGVSNCNSFSWLSGPSGLLSLSCSQEGCLHRTNTSWIWVTMTLLQQISDILAQSSWAQKKNSGLLFDFLLPLAVSCNAFIVWQEHDSVKDETRLTAISSPILRPVDFSTWNPFHLWCWPSIV